MYAPAWLTIVISEYQEKQKCASLCTRFSVDKTGNINSWLKNGDGSKVSYQTASRIITYVMQYWPTFHQRPAITFAEIMVLPSGKVPSKIIAVLMLQPPFKSLQPDRQTSFLRGLSFFTCGSISVNWSVFKRDIYPFCDMAIPNGSRYNPCCDPR